MTDPSHERGQDLKPSEPPTIVGTLVAPVDLDDQSAWILATAPSAVAYATSLLRDRERAEDVVQECYCRLLAKVHDYDLARDGLKLLLRSVSNACINFKTRRRPTISLFGSRAGERDQASWIADRSAPDPSRRLLDQELASAIDQGLARLPVPQRAALELKSQGHTLQEIAEILEVSPSNAGVLVHRARSAMETNLAPYLGRP